ncbi:MAG: hypothetical protein KKI09_01760 [Spirochaetes bacterium]|nr:hypothetical protein [Spirochaetota bacterium]
MLLSCNFPPEAPPYAYGRPQLLVSEDSDGLQRIILTLTVQNLASATTSKLGLCFRLYDADGIAQPPFGSNYFELELSSTIAAGLSSMVELELHPLFFHPLQNGLQIIGLCIKEIDYLDGSSWVDSACLYQYPQAIRAGIE